MRRQLERGRPAASDDQRGDQRRQPGAGGDPVVGRHRRGHRQRDQRERHHDRRVLPGRDPDRLAGGQLGAAQPALDRVRQPRDRDSRDRRRRQVRERETARDRGQAVGPQDGGQPRARAREPHPGGPPHPGHRHHHLRAAPEREPRAGGLRRRAQRRATQQHHAGERHQQHQGQQGEAHCSGIGPSGFGLEPFGRSR